MKLDDSIPTVLLPIETLTRELDSKLIMASALCAKGCRAVVGHKESISTIAHASTGVVWQGKSVFSNIATNNIADKLIGNHSAIIYLQDEGGIHQVKSWQNYVLRKHRIEYLKRGDAARIYVWGERQRDLLISHAEKLNDIIVVTGSPIFDLCLPEYAWITDTRSAELRERYGPFILVCTRFVDAVHFEGQGDPFRKKMNLAAWAQSMSQEKLADIWFSKWQGDVHDFADFVVLTKEIAINYPTYTVVLRPHPSENITFYQQAFSSFKNVVVTREDSIRPWINASELVVHSNCTTGIEAVLLRRPVLNLLPKRADRTVLDVEVAREAGHVASSIDEALQKTGELLSGGVPIHIWSSHAKAILNNLTCAAIPKVTAETMTVIRERNLSSRLVLPKESMIRNTSRRALRGIGKFFVGSKRQPLAAEHVTSSSYVASKRGPLDEEKIDGIISGYRERHGGGGHIRHVTEKYVVLDPN